MAIHLLRNLLWVLLLSLVGFLGGVATTSMWPIQAQTQYFTAEVRVAPSLLQASTVHNPTVFGDIDMDFDGPVPAPGIEARVQVREEVTDLFASAQLDVEDFQPQPEELRAAVRSGLTELAIKFGAGALVSVLALVVMWQVGHRDRHWRRALTGAGTATVLAVAAPSAAAFLTYRSDHLAEFRTTSLLSTVRGNSGLFGDIEGQARKAAPYVQNLFALSEALRQEYTPIEEGGAQAAARFLLVSDIHGMNYFPLIEQIIADQDVDAVIDTGDLLNFGRVREGEVSGIFEAIEDLGVPYVFVRGNHDAVAAGDEAVLQRMAQIPNVVLLEPTDGEYRQAAINGVSISGFNDVRFFGQTGVDFGAAQQRITEQYAAAVDGRDPTDLIISHQPYAVDGLTAGAATLNGHMHRAELDGQHIQVGTFTGGGLVNHFQIPDGGEEELTGELLGQPYAFDILAFGQDCAIDSLTRYSYRNLVSGRPQYDDVRLINGDVIDTQAPEDRTCGPAQGQTLVPIAADGGAPSGDAAATTAP